MAITLGKCASCGTQNAEGSRFCAQCGAELGLRCASCDADLAPAARFCSICGQPVEEVHAVEERKVVTVLFADLVGSTALGESLDTERLQEVVNTYLAGMRAEIEAAGGTVEKFIGDAVMAVFGLPISHDDDADRALHAALAMRRRLEAVNDELERTHDVRLENRIGVNTGQVIAVTGPTEGERLLGDAVNVASRLEHAAEAGQILVGERTARTARRFELREVGELELKGKGAPVAAFALEGERVPDAAPHLRAPLIGRDRELELLRGLYARVAAERRPHLATIYGNPGVGKSRIVRELADALAAEADPPETVTGRCPPYGEGLTYWPLAEILKRRAGVLDSDSAEVTFEKIDAAGRSLLGDGLSVNPTRTIALLAYTVGVDHPDVPLREESPRRGQGGINEARSGFFAAVAGGPSAGAAVGEV